MKKTSTYLKAKEKAIEKLDEIAKLKLENAYLQFFPISVRLFNCL